MSAMEGILAVDSICFLLISWSKSGRFFTKRSCSNSKSFLSPRTLWKLYMLSWMNEAVLGERRKTCWSAWSTEEEPLPRKPWRCGSWTSSLHLLARSRTIPRYSHTSSPAGCRRSSGWNCWPYFQFFVPYEHSLCWRIHVLGWWVAVSTGLVPAPGTYDQSNLYTHTSC